MLKYVRHSLALVASVGMVILSLGHGVVAEGAADSDRYALVDPELKAHFVEMHKRMGDFPPITAEGLPALRAFGAKYERPLRPDVPVAEYDIPVAATGGTVKVYVVNAATAGSTKPVIVHTHGGGYISGSAKSSVRPLQDMAATLDCIAVTIEYQLAPEAPYSVSVEENHAALKWVYDNASNLGADHARIALLGESAGGGHAALLAITARDRGEVPVLFQALIYPMLDDRTGSSVQVPEHIGKLIWTVESNRFGWESFLGTKPGTDSVPEAGVPARTKSLVGLPPTFIGVGALDLFVAEDIAYASRLINAGVPTELLVVPGAYHGFDGIASETAAAKAFTKAKLDALRRAFNMAQ